MHKDLNARFVDVIAAPKPIVHTQDRIQISQQICVRQKCFDQWRYDWCAALTAPDENLKAQFFGRIANNTQANIMEFDGCTVSIRPCHRNLKFARQKREFRVEGGPLANNFRPDPWVIDLIISGTGIGVGCYIADAVAAGLDRVKIHLGQIVKQVWGRAQSQPVVLDVLARCKMTITTVVFAGDVREFSHLIR